MTDQSNQITESIPADPNSPFEAANAQAHEQFAAMQQMLAQTIREAVAQQLRASGISTPAPTLEPGMSRYVGTDPGHRCARCNQPNAIYVDNAGNTAAHCHNPNCRYLSYPAGAYVDEDGVINNVSRELVPVG